jgi:hypothetical protein
MRGYVIDIMINTILKAAENARMEQDELMTAMSSVMAGILEDVGSNLMDIDLGDVRLVVGLRKNTPENTPDSDVSVH